MTRTPLDPPYDLGAIIGRVQSRYIRAAPPREVFAPLLEDVLACTSSEYGFMAEVLHDGQGAPYLEIYVLTDISWDAATRALYERHQKGGPGDALEFRNMNTLFGAAVTSGQLVISNNPSSDPRRGGRPGGHPPLNAFLGVPLFHGGEMVGMIGLANRPGGYEQALADRLQPLFSSVGAIFGAVRSDRERRQAEQALREAQQELQNTFDLAAVGIVRLTLDGMPLMVNQRLCDMLGRTHAEQMKMNSAEVVHPDEIAAENERRRRLLTGEIPRYRVDRRYVHADGSIVYAQTSMTLARHADGSPAHFIAVVEDITERKLAETALQASQQRFLDLVNSVDGVFWEADLEGRHFTYVSERAEAMTGHTRAEWLEDDFWVRRVHRDDRDQALQLVEGARRDGGARAIEYRFLTKDRRFIWMSSLVTVTRQDGDRRLLRGLIVDTTERKRAESAAVAADAALRANAAKTEFLSRMSHELRTPLNAVLGFAQLLALDTVQPLTPSQQSRVQHISQAGAHLLAMINDVLDLSRIESGDVALSLGVVPVQAVVQEAMAMVAPAAAAADVSVQVDRRSDEGALPATSVRADRLRLRQVLVNLLSNAIKYNRAGGQVILRWPLEAAAGQVHLQVEDTGLGLSAAQQEHLFEPFNRLGIERSGIEGTGIGLVITRHLVHLMGGQLAVDSLVGQGSCFIVSLPTAEAAAPGAAPAGVAPASAGGPAPACTVLYVEDNPMNVELVRQVFTLRPGCRLEVATTGVQALAMAQRLRPDLMLVDIHLGDMSGLALSEQLQQDPLLAQIPRIALSADASPEQQRAARMAGFSSYLTKPLDVAQLLRSLDLQLARLRQAR